MPLIALMAASLAVSLAVSLSLAMGLTLSLALLALAALTTYSGISGVGSIRGYRGSQGILTSSAIVGLLFTKQAAEEVQESTTLLARYTTSTGHFVFLLIVKKIEYSN